MEQENPTKFHKSMGNVKDEDVTDGEIRLLQYVVHDCENQIVAYRLKELKIAAKIKKLWESIKEQKQLAQESRIFVDEHPLFAAISLASGIQPEKGRKLFYKRVEEKIKNKTKKSKKADNGKNEEAED